MPRLRRRYSSRSEILHPLKDFAEAVRGEVGLH
jgi:hypothetical protein